MLVAVNTSNGERKAFSSSNQRVLDTPTWLPDGSGLLVLAREQSSNFNRSQISFVSYPGGFYSPVTRDTNSYTDLSVDGSGYTIAAVQSEFRWGLQVIPADGPAAQVRQLTSAGVDTNIAWTSDRHVISDQSNTLNLVDPVSGSKTPMPEMGVSGNPSICPDGSILFNRFLNGVQKLWRMDVNGSNLKQVTDGQMDVNGVCSPDGQWVYFMDQAGQQRLKRMPLNGGAPQLLSEQPSSGSFDISPDGKLAAFPTLEHSGEHKEKLALAETNSGKVVKTADFERPRFGILHFSRDGKGVVYPTRMNGVDNL